MSKRKVDAAALSDEAIIEAHNYCDNSIRKRRLDLDGLIREKHALEDEIDAREDEIGDIIECRGGYVEELHYRGINLEDVRHNEEEGYFEEEEESSQQQQAPRGDDQEHMVADDVIASEPSGDDVEQEGSTRSSHISTDYSIDSSINNDDNDNHSVKSNVTSDNDLDDHFMGGLDESAFLDRVMDRVVKQEEAGHNDMLDHDWHQFSEVAQRVPMKPGDRQAVHWLAKQLGLFSGHYDSIESFMVRLNNTVDVFLLELLLEDEVWSAKMVSGETNYSDEFAVEVKSAVKDRLKFCKENPIDERLVDGFRRQIVF